MDCIFSDLRLKNQVFDQMIIDLQRSFPVGNYGDPNTPHECLGRTEVKFIHLNSHIDVDVDYKTQNEESTMKKSELHGSRYVPQHSSWMLKLKEDSFENVKEYRQFLDQRIPPSSSHHMLDDGIPRIIWMFW